MSLLKFFLFIFFAASAFVGHAQSVNLGAKGGLNFARFSYEVNGNKTTGDFWARYHVGIYADFRFARFSIQPEVLYSRQGSLDSDPSSNARLNFEYVSIPVLFKYYLPKGFNLQAGPQMSVLVRAALETESNGATASLDIKDSFHKYDWAMCVGVGWDSPFRLTTSARYNAPINNIGKSNVDTRNQVIQLSVGYRLFKFGK